MLLDCALSYYEKFEKLFNRAKETNVAYQTMITPAQCAIGKAEILIYIARAPDTENPEQYAWQAVEICQSCLSDANNQIKNNMDNYANIKELIADGYRELAKCSGEGSQEAEEYQRRAYDELHLLFNKKYKGISLERRLMIGYSAIFTECCTAEDLANILGNYQEFWQHGYLDKNPEQIVEYAGNTCDACKYIIENYGYSQEAWELGKKALEEIEGIENYIPIMLKSNFDLFDAFFHSDVSHVANPYREQYGS